MTVNIIIGLTLAAVIVFVVWKIRDKKRNPRDTRPNDPGGIDPKDLP